MISTLFVLAQISLTDAMLASSSIAEDDYTPWAAITTYAVGGRCIKQHRIYESLRADNINKDPSDVSNTISSSPWWLDVGPTNRWAMFDGQASSQTIGSESITVVLRPGFFNAVYLGFVYAETMSVVFKDAPGGTIIYSETRTLEGSAPDNYYDHFFGAYQPISGTVISDIPLYSTAEITITLSSVAGEVKCGVMALGDRRPLGVTQRGFKVKPKTYSYIKIDEYGNNQIVRRKSSKDLSATAWVDLDDAASVLDTVTDLLDVPSVWISPGCNAYGLGSGEMSYDYPQHCLLSINVQGLI